MKKTGGIKIIIIGVVLAVIVVGYFYYRSATFAKNEGTQEEVVESTQVQMVLMRDLEKEYPPSPKEVIKYFSEITKCFYNEKYTDDQLYELAMKIQGIYDDELIANQTEEEYLKNLKEDIVEMKAKDRSIFSYDVSVSTDVEYFNEGIYSYAKLYCSYNIRQGSEKFRSRLVFVLREDENKHWKILGWELDD